MLTFESDNAVARVLVIDDHDSINTILTEVLGSFGCTVYTATTAADGIAIARVKALDVIFVDIRLPDTMGDDVLEILRKILPRVSVIMMTGYDDHERAMRCMELGATDYITKPFDFDYLKTTLLTSVICN